MISPWVIYLISVLNIVKVISIITTILSGGLSFIAFPVFFDDDEEQGKKFLKIGVCVFAISLFVAMLIPTKDEMYLMLALNYLTSENIELLQSFGIDSVQQLSDVIANSIHKTMEGK